MSMNGGRRAPPSPFAAATPPDDLALAALDAQEEFEAPGHASFAMVVGVLASETAGCVCSDGGGGEEERGRHGFAYKVGSVIDVSMRFWSCVEVPCRC